MSEKLRLLDVFEGKRHHKVVLIISVAAFLLLELLIYLTAASQAGQKSRVTILDANGSKIYETAGTTLTSYEKLVFENNFGPLRNYTMQLDTESFPFPFRAWMSAAVGIPVGLTLLVSFLVKAYLSLLYGEDRDKDRENLSFDRKGSLFGSLYSAFHQISIFQVGLLVVMVVLIFWVVPNFLGDFASVTVAGIREYKWFFLGFTVFLASLITWVIYLRYKLSKQMLENQFNLERIRVEHQLLPSNEPPRLLTNSMNEVQEQ